MAKTFLDILKPAQATVLHTMLPCSAAVSLREIAYRSELQVRSVQLALESLLAAGLIKKELEERLDNRCYYSLSESPNIEPLKKLLTTELACDIENRASDTARAKTLLRSLESMNDFARSIKRAR